MKVEDQPAPIKTKATPSWELVILFTQYLQQQTQEPDVHTVFEQLIADMQERHKVGVKRYGTPLQAGNGRNHLVDAYQELLDFTVYIRTQLEEMQVDPLRVLHAMSGMPVEEVFTEEAVTFAQLFLNSVTQLAVLRRIISAQAS